MFFVFFILLFICCDGFLIDTTNPPGSGQYMTDKHYKFLMDFVIEERQARVHLEDVVTQLQNELVKTQTALGNKLHALNKENNTIEQYVNDLKNKTEVLDIRLLDVESENIQLKTELKSLRTSHSALEVQYNQIKQNYATFENKTHYFETEIHSLKQLKSVSDLQAVFRISNQTDHLEHELQNTNSQIIVLQSSDNARKQDFLALYNKTMVTEQSMNSQFIKTNTQIQKVAADVNQNGVKVTKALGDIIAYNERSKIVMMLKNKLPQKNKLSNYQYNKKKSAVSLYPISKTYSSGSTIMFTGIKTSNGLNSTSLADVQNKGYFTCYKDGLYWISLSVTFVSSARIDVYKNKGVLHYMYLQHVASHELATFASLVRLSKGDTIMAKASGTIIIAGNAHSVLSVFQLTT